MDTRDKNQELTGEGYMAPDSGMSLIQFDPGFALLTDNELATTLSENELKELQEKKKKPATPFQDSMRRLRRDKRAMARSEEHTSELQSRPHLVCRLLLEKK